MTYNVAFICSKFFSYPRLFENWFAKLAVIALLQAFSVPASVPHLPFFIVLLFPVTKPALLVVTKKFIVYCLLKLSG